MDDYYSLNVHQIQRDRHERDRHKYSTYKRILEKCYFKIKGCSDKDITYCTYQLPDFIFGEPIFNKIYCANYIVEHLRSNGFCCRFFEPNLLYVTWTFAGARKYAGFKNTNKRFEKPKKLELKKNSPSIAVNTSTEKFRIVSEYIPNKSLFFKQKF